MIAPEVIVKIRHLYFAEHWKIGTIASELGLHHDTVRTALETDSFNRIRRERMKPLINPYLEFIADTLTAHPRLRATRLFQMIRSRGYNGSTSYLRRVVHQLRGRHRVVRRSRRQRARGPRRPGLTPRVGPVESLPKTPGTGCTRWESRASSGMNSTDRAR